MAATDKFITILLRFGHHLTAMSEVFSSRFDMQMLGITAIVALGVPSLIARLFLLSRHNGGQTSRTFKYQDGLATEQSTSAFARTHPIPLIFGPTAGVTAALVAAWNDSSWFILSAWVRKSL
jgi:hypothetical protein